MSLSGFDGLSERPWKGIKILNLKFGRIRLLKFGISSEIIGSFVIAKLNKNINKTEVTKMKMIINQIYTLNTKSIF